jgi:hypothetical protein
MNKNDKSFFKIVDGKSVPFNPSDVNGEKIEFFSTVIMPDPNGTDDHWKYGGFSATVIDTKNDGELITVEDSDGDFFDVEPNRVEVVKD